MNELEFLAKQAENAARTQATRARASVRAQTSLVNRAAAQLGQASAALQRPAQPHTKKSGVYIAYGEAPTQYIADGTPYATARSVPGFRVRPPAAIHGARRSPVQPLRTPRGYWPRLIRKVLGNLLLFAAIILVFALIIDKL